MEKRDLKADLELCNRASGESWKQASDIGYPYTIMDETFENVMAVYCTGDDAQFIAQAREGWPHAIERALEAEKRVEELENQVDILSTTLNMYCSPYYDMWERAEKAEALARELVAALQGVSGMLDYATGECRCGVCEYCNVQKRADKALAKAKEVLGDE